jgi:hypothetical protein
MPREIRTFFPMKSKKADKTKISKKTKKGIDTSRNRKLHKDSSDDDSDDFEEEEEEDDDDDDDDDLEGNDDENEEDDDFGEEQEDEERGQPLDVHEYRKMLASLFPSKHLNKKIEAGEKLKRRLEAFDDDEYEVQDHKSKKKEKKATPKSPKTPKMLKKTKVDKGNKVTKTKKPRPAERSDQEDSEEEEEYENSREHAGKYNIIFTIGGQNEDDEWDDYDEDDDFDSDYETEDEDEEVSTSEDEDEEEAEDDTEYENEDGDEKEDEDQDQAHKQSEQENDDEGDLQPRRKRPRRKDDKTPSDEDIFSRITGDNDTDETIVQNLKLLATQFPGNKMIEGCKRVCLRELKEKKKKAERRIEKTKEKHERIFRRVIRDKNTLNDVDFFKKLDTSEQKKVIKEVKEINKIIRVEKPYRLAVLESQIPSIFKAHAMKKIGTLRYMDPGSGEYFKIKNWVDTFMRIPFGKYMTLPVTITDGIEACHAFMEEAQHTLNSAVYGLTDAKMQIMQMLGQLITNPAAIGTAIAIHGPPGTGKTSLVKEGISKILQRPFAFIALGGATDSSFLEGHSYTYEGSIWGKIVQILIDSKCMNPVIYFDELDKISDTPKGEEIAGILTHLTDTSQNSQFHDKYFAEIDFDLSKCLFIFSYNDESKVSPILKDRMYRIMTKGYDKKQKTTISASHLLPRIREQIKFNDEDIVLPAETIHHIIDTHCDKEDGVRNLKRCLEIVFTKLNLYRLMKPGTNLFAEELSSLVVEFPMTVTKEVVDKLIRRDRDDNVSWRAMYL